MKMKAIAYLNPLPIENEDALMAVEVAVPAPGPRDLLVRVKAVSVNPVDAKVRAGVKPEPGQPRILGWDAVGIVEATGSEARHYRVGDRVYYAGSIARPGTNAELHVVDERIVGRAPQRLDDLQAAALPLTSITAWELLFDRLKVARGGGDGQTLLVIGGAGGVGSMLIQLGRQLTQLRVVATASRPETRRWCLDLGAHDVIDHSQPLLPQLKALGLNGVAMVASLTQTDRHYAAIVEALLPQGQLAVIDEPRSLDVTKMKNKSLSLHWELMFTRPLFGTPDLEKQRELLDEVSALADSGRIRSTAHGDHGSLSVANLRRAHALIESGRALGKVVLRGFPGAAP